MKSAISNLFVVALFGCLSIKHASSIKCYDCKTNILDGTDTKCREQLDDSMTRECSAAFCSIVTKTQENGDRFLTRSCGWITNGTSIGDEVKSGEDHGQYTEDGAHVTWSTCATDLCNTNHAVTHINRMRRQISDFFGGTSDQFPPGLGHGSKGKEIQCYACTTNPLDETDTTCSQNMSTKTCYYGACRIIKVTMAGDTLIQRLCDHPGLTAIVKQLPKNKDPNNDKITRFGVSVSWSRCTTDLCNWGVMNKYQAITLLVSAMLSLSFYSRLL